MKFPFAGSTPSPTFLKWFLIVLAVTLVGVFISNRAYGTTRVMLGGEEFIVRLADTEAKRVKGLGGTAPVGRSEGMLFVFQRSAPHQFWMKGLTYPLDIVWISDGVIVDIAPRVPPAPQNTPDEKLPHYGPRLPADRVLEVAAGTVERLGVKIGDRVEFSK